MRFREEIGKWVGRVVEIFLLLLALGVSAEILIGNKGPFFGGTVAALTGLVGILGANGIIGLIALGVIAFIIRKKKATRPENPQ